MSKHVIVGAGPIGTATALLLAERGDEVTLVTRSGSGPTHPAITKAAADASSAEALTDLATGAVALYNCANPAYNKWPTDWPPIARALLGAAESSGAVLVTVSNLYGYGPVSGPMTEDLPLAATGSKGQVRVQMWRDALAAHEAGLVRATEVRGSDYLGPDVQGHLGDRVVPKLLAGKGVTVMQSADTLHTWTATDDVARLLVTVAWDERAWGRPWHVPSNPPRTQRQAIDDLCRIAGVPAVSVKEYPGLLIRAMGLMDPVMRELPEVAYQLKEPFILDSTAAQQTFGLAPMPWDDALAMVIQSFR